MNATAFRFVLSLFAAVLPAQAHVSASEVDEFLVNRKEVYEFTEAPSVTREGDRVEIRFASKDFCDVTVASSSATPGTSASSA